MAYGLKACSCHPLTLSNTAFPKIACAPVETNDWNQIPHTYNMALVGKNSWCPVVPAMSLHCLALFFLVLLWFSTAFYETMAIAIQFPELQRHTSRFHIQDACKKIILFVCLCVFVCLFLHIFVALLREAQFYFP